MAPNYIKVISFFNRTEVWVWRSNGTARAYKASEHWQDVLFNLAVKKCMYVHYSSNTAQSFKMRY